MATERARLPEEDTEVVRGGLRARLVPGVPLAALAPGGDPDRLLTRPECAIVKMQRKVTVGRITTGLGALYVKRYNVFAARVALGALGRPSPAFAAWTAARALARLGFGVPEVVAAVEVRRAGWLRKSFFVTRAVTGTVPADVRWQTILAESDGPRRRAAQRALARALGDLFRRLHADGVYHNDLKDANILVGGPVASPACVLLDLERVRLGARLTTRRRQKNLMQLARTLGRQASATDRLRFLAAYLGPESDRGTRRRWATDVLGRAARKDARRPAATPAPARARVSAAVICQDEERHLARCLESITWCDEIVVVDGGSRDGTAGIARRFTERVLTHAWPGHRPQKQYALDAARGDWVFNVDADERVTPDLATEIRRALARVPDDVDGFAIERLVCYLGRWWQRGALRPRPVLRLVRRSMARWGGRDPHERAEVPGRVRRLRSPLLHYTYDDMGDHVRSANTLTTIAAGRDEPPGRIGVARLVLEPAWRFLRAHVVRGGWRDGVPGLFVSATAAFYVWLRWAKVWERLTVAPPDPTKARR
jgi:hypothetical protein